MGETTEKDLLDIRLDLDSVSLAVGLKLGLVFIPLILILGSLLANPCLGHADGSFDCTYCVHNTFLSNYELLSLWPQNIDLWPQYINLWFCLIKKITPITSDAL